LSGIKMKKYKHDVIRSFVCSLLEGYGVPAKKAQITSDVLVETDLRGIFSHGINLLDIMIVPSLIAGGIIPDAVAEDQTRNPDYPIRHIDAHGDMGYSVAMGAVSQVKTLAANHGYGKAYVFNANHFGAAGIYSETICQEKNLSGRVTCTTPSFVKPYAGKKNRLGTNLISWSIPYDRGIVTIDMATTIHAVSGIIKALVEGAPLPFPVYDRNIQQTSDPAAFKDLFDFLNQGSMIPLGGLGEGGADAGYKGSGLAILVELDSVIGGGVSGFVSPLAFDKERWVRQTFEAWRIDTLFPAEPSLQKISETVRNIRKDQGHEMLLPGEKEAKNREKSLREGIPYTEKQIFRLEKMGQAVGLGNVS
ncbi:MAG: Ldh family oxidoreductase, partial [Candidatus Aminicenantes bacterium]